MTLRSGRTVLAATGIAVAGLIGALTTARTAAQDKPLLSDQVFKNVQVLKGIPVDDFLGTMGIMAAALQFDCSDCHVNAGTEKVDWAADTPRKQMARVMVTMVATINKNNFGGRQLVTCWTCHRNRDKPLVTPVMATIYGTPTVEPDDVIAPVPGAPSAESILDKYIEAAGGAQRLAGLTSFVGKGTSVSFGGFGGGGDVELVAQAPDKRATIIIFKEETGRGDQIRAYDGRTGWLRTPLNVLGEFQLTGTDLDGARVDAQLSFPGQIKQILTNLRTGPPTTIADLPAPTSQSVLQQGLPWSRLTWWMSSREPDRGAFWSRCTSTGRADCCCESCGTAALPSAAFLRRLTLPTIVTSTASRCRSESRSRGWTDATPSS